MEFGVIHTEENQSDALFLHEVEDVRIIIAFVLSSQNQHGWLFHAFEGIPTSIHVRCLGIVHEINATHSSRLFESMLHTCKTAQSLANHFVRNACDVGSDTCCKRVVEVVLACKCQFLLLHIEWRWLFNHVFLVLGVSNGIILVEFRERIELCLEVVLCQFLLHDWIVVPKDESIVLRLVTSDSHLRIDIVLHLEVVTVQVVGGDIHQHSNVSTEVVHVIQLEARQFNHIVIEMLFCHLKRQTSSYISCQTHIVACLFQNVIDERGGGRLTIRTRNTNHLGIRISTSKFNFRDNRNLLFLDFHNHRC